MSICPSCNKEAYRFVSKATEHGVVTICNECTVMPPFWMPDVYLGAEGGIKTDPNLVDPKTGKEMPFSTKREKAAIMNYLQLKQADSAERQHGSRNEVKRKKYFI